MHRSYLTSFDYYLNSSGVLSSGFSQIPLYGTDVYSSTTSKNWRDKIAKHKDASTPYINRRVVSSTHQPLWSVRGPWPFYNSDFSVNFSELPLFRPLPTGAARTFRDTVLADIPKISHCDTIANDKYFGNLKKEIAYFNELVPIGEYKELIRLMEELFHLIHGLLTLNMHEIYHVFVKKDTKNRAHVLADFWLNFSFAISPLIGDIQSAAENVARYVDNPASARVNGHNKEQLSGVQLMKFTDLLFGTQTSVVSSYANYTISRESFVDVRYASAIKFQLHFMDSILEPTKLFQSQMANIASAAWELVPFSWVADYFATVGNFLENYCLLSPELSQTIYRTKSVNIRSVYKLDVEYDFATAGWSKAVKSPLFKGFPSIITPTLIVGVYDKRRDPLANMPVPDIRFKMPSEISDNWPNKLANLLSIFVNGRFGRRTKLSDLLLY